MRSPLLSKARRQKDQKRQPCHAVGAPVVVLPSGSFDAAGCRSDQGAAARREAEGHCVNRKMRIDGICTFCSQHCPSKCPKRSFPRPASTRAARCVNDGWNGASGRVGNATGGWGGTANGTEPRLNAQSIVLAWWTYSQPFALYLARRLGIRSE